MSRYVFKARQFLCDFFDEYTVKDKVEDEKNSIAQNVSPRYQINVSLRKKLMQINDEYAHSMEKATLCTQNDQNEQKSKWLDYFWLDINSETVLINWISDVVSNIRAFVRVSESGLGLIFNKVFLEFLFLRGPSR